MGAHIQLICMPFQLVSVSSLSIALLSTVLRQHGVCVSETYLHFELARLLGFESYHSIADGGTKLGLLGELLFAENLYGEIADAHLQPLLTRHFGGYAQRCAILRQFEQYCLDVIAEAQADRKSVV